MKGLNYQYRPGMIMLERVEIPRSRSDPRNQSFNVAPASDRRGNEPDCNMVGNRCPAECEVGFVARNWTNLTI